MINKDILKKINDIYKSGKTIDEDSIKELGYLYAIENGLEEYVRDIQIKEDFEDSGVYKAGSKEVKLNFSVIDDDVIGMYKPKTTEDYTYCFNYQAIKDLLHEIQHADQEHLYEYRYKPYNHFENRKFFITISALDFLYNAASTKDETNAITGLFSDISENTSKDHSVYDYAIVLVGNYHHCSPAPNNHNINGNKKIRRKSL